MHLAIVVLTMLILPAASVLVEHQAGAPWWPLIGKWFVFWGAGVRLSVAGGRQVAKPGLTAEGIFGVADRKAWPLAQELGFWNLTIGALSMATLLRPAWLPPLALASGSFYAMAGIKHVLSAGRNFAAQTAMVSDLAMAAVLIASWWMVWRGA